MAQWFAARVFCNKIILKTDGQLWYLPLFIYHMQGYLVILVEVIMNIFNLQHNTMYAK